MGADDVDGFSTSRFLLYDFISDYQKVSKGLFAGQQRYTLADLQKSGTRK